MYNSPHVHSPLLDLVPRRNMWRFEKDICDETEVCDVSRKDGYDKGVHHNPIPETFY